MIYHRKGIVDQFTPLAIYETIGAFYKKERLFLLESAINNDEGNFSYITIGALEEVCVQKGKTFHVVDGKTRQVDKPAFTYLQELYHAIDFEQYKRISEELKVDFVDGFVGFIGYDMVQEFEPVLKPVMGGLKDELQTPDMHLVRPKAIAAYSHKNSSLTLITSDKKTYKSFDKLFDAIHAPHPYTPIKKVKIKDEGAFSIPEASYKELVGRAKENIRSGDIFQILLSNRYTQKLDIDPFSFYRVLKSKNPSPYMYYLDYGDYQIVGSSPEVMVRLEDGDILLKPIAGTRKRGKNLSEDLALEQELLADEKERAEHLMLVDLGRNDVGRVAKKGSVKVADLMHVEHYSHVMHIVSDVVGKLDEPYDMFDLFAATFTAGTMTGAPKIKAMELIAKYEGLKRGFYSGSIGYFGFNGNVNSAITIRTAMLKDKHLILQAGGGVVADSTPEGEWQEVQNKLGALKATIEEMAKIKE